MFALSISFFNLIAFCLDNIRVAKYMVIHKYTRTKLELSNVKAIETTTQVHVFKNKIKLVNRSMEKILIDWMNTP